MGDGTRRIDRGERGYTGQVAEVGDGTQWETVPGDLTEVREGTQGKWPRWEVVVHSGRWYTVGDGTKAKWPRWEMIQRQSSRDGRWYTCQVAEVGDGTQARWPKWKMVHRPNGRGGGWYAGKVAKEFSAIRSSARVLHSRCPVFKPGSALSSLFQSCRKIVLNVKTWLSAVLSLPVTGSSKYIVPGMKTKSKMNTRASIHAGKRLPRHLELVNEH